MFTDDWWIDRAPLVALGFAVLLIVLFCLALGRAAAMGDHAISEWDARRNARPLSAVSTMVEARPAAALDLARARSVVQVGPCPVCGDPVGIRCCEYGADR